MARSYRVARRSFLGAVGGAVGLNVLLRNLEAAAEGASSPPRFVLTHWPQGTLRHRFRPTGAGAAYTASPLVQPFVDAGLRSDMTVLFGFSDAHLSCPSGGGVEAGTVFTTTACNGRGTRQNGGEHDDAVAGGPSFEQIFLRHVPNLARPKVGAVNAICDERVESFETSSRCLSYGYDTRTIASNQVGGDIQEHVPLLPTLEPARLYAQLFAGFMPGGDTPENQEAALLALTLRKSVLDHARVELAQLQQLVPHSEAFKIELHTQAIRQLELRLQDAAAGGGACLIPGSPAADLVGKSGNARWLDPPEDDTARHQAVAEAHLAIILAALQCDITRVATFQFAPGVNQVGFRGLWPDDPERIERQLSSTRSSLILRGGADDDPSLLSGDDLERYEFLTNVQKWYNQRLASWLAQLKAAPDAFGGTLLDTTVVPYVTEVAQGNSSRSPKPALLFGGGKLGLAHGTFQDFSPARPQVDLYLTCAQALLQTPEPLVPLAEEAFVASNPTAAPIAGLWAPPA